MMRSLVALGLVAMTCACAPLPGMGRRSAPEAPPPPPPSGPQVFISPFGEPYRADPGQPYPVAAWFATVDTDGDGKATPAEFNADGRRFFIALDANQDDQIGSAEIVAYEAMTTRLFEGGVRGSANGSSTATGQSPVMSMPAMAGLLNVPQPIKAADVDVNQRVTPEEWVQAGDRWFRLLDADRDGVLIPTELPRTRFQRGDPPR